MKLANFYTKITFIALLVFAFNGSYGQSKFLTGYVIKPNGDTVHGYVDYRNWSVNPEKISFKEQLTDDNVVYTCADINGFGVAGEIYIKATVAINESKSNTNELDLSAEVIYYKDSVFLQALIRGTKSLYRYKNKSVLEQFYIWQDTAYNLLIYKKYLTVPNSNPDNYASSNTYTPEQRTSQSIAENTRYLNQLAMYLSDCPNIQSNFKDLEYSRKSLEQLFHHYYQCSQSQPEYHFQTEKTKVVTGALAGISITSVTFSGDEDFYVVKTEYQPSVNFAGGFYLNVFFPRNNYKLSFNNELLFTSYKIDGSYTNYKNENVYSIYTTSLGLSYLKLNTMMRYNQPVGNAFIFLNAGVSFGYVIYENNYFKRENVSYDEIHIYENDAIQTLRKYELAINAGIGIKYKKFSLEFRYERGDGMSNAMNLDSLTDRLYSLLGFRF
jgi:hypothetical protein